MPATAIEQFEAVQDGQSRTKVITVTERVAAQTNGEFTEVANSRDVFIRPLPFRRWFQAMTHVDRIVAALPDADIDLGNLGQLALYFVRLLGKVPDELLAITCLATDLPMDVFDRIDPDDGVKIMLAVVEVNKDFFVQKVLPLILEAAPFAKEQIAETFGPTQ